MPGYGRHDVKAARAGCSSAHCRFAGCHELKAVKGLQRSFTVACLKILRRRDLRLVGAGLLSFASDGCDRIVRETRRPDDRALARVF